MIKKINSIYSLTTKGMGLISNLDTLGSIKELFRVSVILYVVREKDGIKELLMQKRRRNPYKGEITTVSGKINPGEVAEEAAKRKLKEETGLNANFKVIGLIRKIRRNKKGDLIEDLFFNVCYAEDPRGDLINSNEFGENFWSSSKDALNYQSKSLSGGPKSKEVMTRVIKGNFNFFYFQEEVMLDA